MNRCARALVVKPVIALVGRPNVGKSTLLNALVGQKVSITSRKAQTTRHRITGIRTLDDTQYIFVDTPGFQTRHGNALNRTLNRTVLSSVADVDVVLFVVEAGRYGMDDAKVLALLPEGKPVILVAGRAFPFQAPARALGRPAGRAGGPAPCGAGRPGHRSGG